MKKSKIKIDKEHLPRYYFLNYCRYCLVSMLEYADEKKLSHAFIDFKDENEKVLFKEYCDSDVKNMAQWLVDNGHKHILYELCYKHLFFSLIVDFSNYYNASIDLAACGNINAAWALLRKPLQETLAYLEWLYVEKNELITLMMEQNDVTKYEIIKKKDKIAENIKKIQSGEVSKIIDMFEFRYSRKEELTLNGILQATNHLITTQQKLKTSPSGLNFVFPDDKIIERNIGFYYTSIPYVMLYTMNIVNGIFNDIASLNSYTRIINEMNLKLKNLMAIPTDFKKTKELLPIAEVPIFCPRCGKKHKSDKAWFSFINGTFKCNRCLKKINTNKLIFDYEKINFVWLDENNEES